MSEIIIWRRARTYQCHGCGMHADGALLPHIGYPSVLPAGWVVGFIGARVIHACSERCEKQIEVHGPRAQDV